MPDNDLRYFSKGKWAIEKLASAFIRSIGKENGRIFIPEYFCEISLTPLRIAEHNLHFYRINSELEPDIDHLNSLVKKYGAPDILLYVQYFGFPLKIKDTIRWCKENEALLIEDAAHSMLPVPGIGDNGCPTVYTPWKFLGLTEGGVLVLPDEMASIFEQSAPNTDNKSDIFKTVALRTGASAVDFIGMRGFPIHKFKKPYVKEPDESEQWQDPKTPEYYNRSLKILSNFDKKEIEKIKNNRERNYRRIDDAILNSSINKYRLFRKLPKLFAPYVYPLRVPENISMKAMIELNNKGIRSFPWSDLSPEVKNSSLYPLSNALRREVITLPIHQDMTIKHVDWMAKEVVKQLEKF